MFCSVLKTYQVSCYHETSDQSLFFLILKFSSLRCCGGCFLPLWLPQSSQDMKFPCDASKRLSCFPLTCCRECPDNMSSMLGWQRNFGEQSLISLFLLLLVPLPSQERAFLWMVWSVNFLHLRNIGRKMHLFPQTGLCGACLFLVVTVPQRVAAFNQRLNSVHSDARWRRLIKFLPLEAEAERENPFPAI